MNSQTVVVKTLKGVEEVATKKYKLSPRARTVLILVDGRKTWAELIEMARQLGSPATLLDDFVAQGLVQSRPGPQLIAARASPALIQQQPTETHHRPPEPDEYGRFRVAQRFMGDSIVNTLGIKAFFFTLRLERCATRHDLLALLDSYTAAITKGGSAVEAQLLSKHARELLVEGDVQ